MNMPITNKAAFTPIRNIAGEVNMVVSHSPMASGMPARVMMKAKSPALAMMNMITALETTDFFKQSTMSRRVSSR